MDSSSIAVIVALSMIGLSFVILVVFSFRSIFNGKVSFFKKAFMLIPFVVLLVWYLIVGGNVAEAAVLTVITMFVLGLLAIVLSGLKSVFS
jgi:hypothetical protein